MLKRTLLATLLMAAVPAASQAATKQNLSDLFEWAAETYPQYFPDQDDRVEMQTFQEYEYVYFPETGNYIGFNTNDNAIYVLGPDWNNQTTYVGPVSNLLQQANIAEKFNIAMSSFPIMPSQLEGTWLAKGDENNSNFYVSFQDDGTFTWIDGQVAKGGYTVLGNRLLFTVTDQVQGESNLDGLSLNASISAQAGGVDFLSVEKDGYQFDLERLSSADMVAVNGEFVGEWIAYNEDGNEIKIVFTDDNTYAILGDNDSYGSGTDIESGEYLISGSSIDLMPNFDNNSEYSTPEIRSITKVQSDRFLLEFVNGNSYEFERI